MAKKSSDITFPNSIISAPCIFTASARYVYGRNISDKANTTDRYHGVYYLNDSNLVTYFEGILTDDEKNNWQKSLLADSQTDPKSVFIYSEH